MNETHQSTFTFRDEVTTSMDCSYERLEKSVEESGKTQAVSRNQFVLNFMVYMCLLGGGGGLNLGVPFDIVTVSIGGN